MPFTLGPCSRGHADERDDVSRESSAVRSCGGVEVSLARRGDRAEARIADRGPGLPARALEAMFQPFERGDPSRNRATGGIGLGLSIARAIAQEHGGSLVLANRAGGGLEAVCRLPIRSQALHEGPGAA